jgi:hypothetical protein
MSQRAVEPTYPARWIPVSGGKHLHQASESGQTVCLRIKWGCAELCDYSPLNGAHPQSGAMFVLTASQ